MDKNDLIFWTGIMADHAQFQINALSPQEEKYVREAMMFQDTFCRYNIAAQSEDNNPMYITSIMNDLMSFIEFKKMIIVELLRCNVLINFTPSFINHMVNEAMEFYDLLNNNSTCPDKTQMPATYIKIWIADASGHASSIMSSLDAAETILLQESQSFKRMFDDIYKKSVELEMIQNNIGIRDSFGLLKTETIRALSRFIAFCMDLTKLLDDCDVLATGTFSSVIVNHFIREHEYVLGKLMQCM